MTIYTIWCEWDMGFHDAYSTKAKAQNAIDEMDWEGLTDNTLKQVQEDGIVSINKVKVI